MLKKTITYKDFNDEEVVEDFFFHLSKAELVELEMGTDGGLSESLKRIIVTKDGKEIIKEFKNIILGSYGKRSTDGRRFTKTQELRDEFESSEAYSVLFMELVTDTDAAVVFINGIVPAGLAEEAAKIAAASKEPTDKPAETPVLEAEAPKLESVPDQRETITQAQFVELTEEDRRAIVDRIAAGEVKIVP